MDRAGRVAGAPRTSRSAPRDAEAFIDDPAVPAVAIPRSQRVGNPDGERAAILGPHPKHDPGKSIRLRDATDARLHGDRRRPSASRKNHPSAPCVNALKESRSEHAFARPSRKSSTSGFPSRWSSDHITESTVSSCDPSTAPTRRGRRGSAFRTHPQSTRSSKDWTRRRCRFAHSLPAAGLSWPRHCHRSSPVGSPRAS